MTKIKLFFKNEGYDEKGNIVGPLYKQKGRENSNYQNGMKSFDGQYFAKWFTYPEAIKIAKKLGVKIELV